MEDTLLIKKFIEGQKDSFFKHLEKIVRLESPAYGCKEASDRCGKYLQELFGGIGFDITVFPQKECGDHFVAKSENHERKLILIGHYDTVFPMGTIKTMPWKMQDGKAYGPGCLDMKGGLLMGYYAVKALRELNLMPETEIIFFISGDEESGSHTSRNLIIEEAKKCVAALILEPAPEGAGYDGVKNARYGRNIYTITVYGKTAHSGNSPHLAESPILELSHLISSIDAMNDHGKGLKLSPTFVQAGAKETAVIPGEALLVVDVRFATEDILRKAREKLLALKPKNPNIILDIREEFQKPPLEYHVKNQELFKKTAILAKELDMDLKGHTAGGGSDGNFTSFSGVPTLDGLGMTGEFLHNRGEYVFTDHIPQRTALLARLIQTL